MPLADDLLTQAEQLLRLDARKPRQANLRRSISTSYYALFHLLIGDGVLRISPSKPVKLAARIARAFAHSEMKQVCRTISQGHHSLVLRELQPGGFSLDLRFVAEKFIELQEHRHLADYDIQATYTRVESHEIYELAARAFSTWKSIRLTEEANVFLAALLFGGRWAK